MKAISHIYGVVLVGVMWSIYGVYLVCFDNLLLSPKDIYEILLPAVLQMLILWIFGNIFSEKYYIITSTTFVICAGLVIFWHFSLNHSISRGVVINLFLLLPLLITAISYFINRMKYKVKISILKNFGVVFLSDLVSFIVAVFTFYVFHYWI